MSPIRPTVLLALILFPSIDAESVSAAPFGDVEALAYDTRGNQTLVSAYAVQTVNGVSQRQPLTAQDGLGWIINLGQAQIVADGNSGRYLFRVIGSTPVVATPTVNGVPGSPTTIGISPESIPTVERTYEVAGGGSCNSGGGVSLTLNVRSVVNERVIPLSLSERAVSYETGRYYAYDPVVGLMTITYNPNETSETILTSLSPPSTPAQPFFPASAVSRFFFLIEIPGMGVTVFNKLPMVFTTPSTGWPPFGTMLQMDAPVDFYRVDDPNAFFMTIQNQAMYLYPTTELEVTVLQFQLDDFGNATSQWKIRNLAATPGDIEWFFIGDVGDAMSPLEGTVTLAASGAPSDSAIINLHSRADTSLVPQFVTLGAVNRVGSRKTGLATVTFSNLTQVDIPALSIAGTAVLLLVLGATALLLLRRKGMLA